MIVIDASVILNIILPGVTNSYIRDRVQGLSISRHAHAPMINRVWQLRFCLTSYDATYLALAEALDATLMTCDGGLAGVAQGSVQAALL